MDIQYVLLNPKGRIASRDFLRGLVLLTGAFMIVQVIGTFVLPALTVLVYPLIYPYVCVFSKRLHDAGQSGWLYLLFLLGYAIIGSIASALLMPALSPAAYEMNLEFQQALQGGGMAGVFSEMTDHADELGRKSALTTLVSFLFTSALLGFIGARLPSDPDNNRHGPPTSRQSPSNTFS